jgi:hypothetical protein
MIALFLILVLIYLANFKLNPGHGDALAFRYLPYSIIYERDFDLDEFQEKLTTLYPTDLYEYPNGEKIPYYLIKVKGHYLSSSGIGPSLLSLPFLFIPIVFFRLHPESWTIIFLSKLTASVFIALSAILIYLAVRLLSTKKIALFITFIYALCSGMWSITSQILIQQTGSEFFLALSIYFLVKGIKKDKFIPFAGFSLASAAIMRPTNFLIMGIITIYVIHRHRNQFFWYAISSLPPILLILGYNYWYHGSMFLFSQMICNPLGALYKTGSVKMWSTPILKGILGVLISPSRGLFIYSPVFIFSFFGMILVWKQKRELIFKYFSVVVLAIIIIQAKWYDWWGGWTFGCRALNDTVPFLVLFIVPAFGYLKTKRRLFIIFVITIVISFFIQIIGAFFYDNRWNNSPNIDLHQYRLWSWRDSQLLYYIRDIFHEMKLAAD